MTILMLAMGGAIMIAGSAVPDEDAPVAQPPRIAAGLDRFMEEVQGAMLITERTPAAITFLLADRDDDKEAEVIRYAWSGTPGDPLTRQANGGSIEKILPSVEVFAIACEDGHVTESYASPLIESAELELIAYEEPGRELVR
jgi:hypothetical protein